VSLDRAHVQTRVPARDLDRARRFYAEKLGLEPIEERSGAFLYRCGGDEFAIFKTTGTPDGSHTQMGWQVDDIAATVAELRARGVVFEDYDLPGMALSPTGVPHPLSCRRPAGVPCPSHAR
jgi:catechol 2,3-dioxygenase-like lactoylglutathione lyase family enzyme